MPRYKLGRFESRCHIVKKEQGKSRQEEARSREEKETHEVFDAKQIRAGRGRLDHGSRLPSISFSAFSRS